jgi:hypothetical protein
MYIVVQIYRKSKKIYVLQKEFSTLNPFEEPKQELFPLRNKTIEAPSIDKMEKHPLKIVFWDVYMTIFFYRFF